MKIQQLLILTLLTGISQIANAHTGFHPVEGWISGFAHPFMGVDHMLAMLGVGLWAVCATPNRHQVWQYPLVFMLAMVIGGVLGAGGLLLPGMEIAIAASVSILGFMIMGRVYLPRGFALSIVALFALFHGHAHGMEMGQGADYLAYALGFVCATGVLHLVGIYFGYKLVSRALLYRTAGAMVGGIGFFLLFQAA